MSDKDLNTAVRQLLQQSGIDISLLEDAVGHLWAVDQKRRQAGVDPLSIAVVLAAPDGSGYYARVEALVHGKPETTEPYLTLKLQQVIEANEQIQKVATDNEHGAKILYEDAILFRLAMTDALDQMGAALRRNPPDGPTVAACYNRLVSLSATPPPVRMVDHQARTSVQFGRPAPRGPTRPPHAYPPPPAPPVPVDGPQSPQRQSDGDNNVTSLDAFRRKRVQAQAPVEPPGDDPV